jgi:AcrR family transcriptional regulator
MAASKQTRRKSARLGRPRGSVPKEDRLDEVLRVAARLFRERGYRAARLDEISDELGVTRAALYYYFDTKQALLEEICARSMNTIEEALQDVQALPDPAERLRAFAHEFALNTATDAARVYFRDAKEMRPAFRRGLSERAHRVTVGAEEIIRTGIAEGRFRSELDPHIAASGVLSGLNSLPEWHRADRHGPVEGVVDHLIDVYLHGLVTPGS